MIKVLQRIILLVAVITVTAHSIFPHLHLNEITAHVGQHHHNEQSTGKQHHDHDDTDENKDNQHNLFSLAHLDDDFIPAKDQVKSFDLPLEYLEALNISSFLFTFNINSKLHFGWYIEYPPPDDSLCSLPSRAPPAII